MHLENNPARALDDEALNTAVAEALHANNLTAFHLASGDLRHLDRWVQANVVHAMNACPDVLAYWMTTTSEFGKDQRLYRYTARALEHLNEDEKTELLLGQSTVRARRNLHAYLKKSILGDHWLSVSPLWVGKPGSALRKAAIGLGWRPDCMYRMLVEGMNHPSWERWLVEVPYAYSIVAAHWVMLQAISGEVRLPVAKSEMPTLVCSDHANPADVVVALEMLRVHAPNFVGNMRAPVVWKDPHPQEVQRLHALVRLHWDLGMQDAFVAALHDGRLLGQEFNGDAQFELPAGFEDGVP